LTFYLEKVKKDINRRRTPQKPEQYVKGLNKSPTVGVQLGCGSVDLRHKFPLEPGEGQTHADALEHYLIELKERNLVVGAFVPTQRLPQGAREHSDIIIMPPREGAMIIGARLPFVSPYGKGGKKARALIEKLTRSPGI